MAADTDDQSTDQHFCLRWNNFQANITSQFDALRCNEDFTDVTIACDGQRLSAHKVVLSACSPYFKELFKANPCSHPIVFMRDVEARHIVALMEFMYVGEVNVSQTHLSAFLKTAESLKIRGLTDTSTDSDKAVEESSLYMTPQQSRPLKNSILVNKNKLKISATSTTPGQDVPIDFMADLTSASPTVKKGKSETEIRLRKDDSMTVNPFALQNDPCAPSDLIPKEELPDYISDDDIDSSLNFYSRRDDLSGCIDNLCLPPANFSSKDGAIPQSEHRKLHSLDPRPCHRCGKTYSNASNLRQHVKLVHYPTSVSCSLCKKRFKSILYLKRHVQSAHENYFRLRRKRMSEHWFPYDLHQSESIRDVYYDSPLRGGTDKKEPNNKLIKLGEGIEIYEEQLRSVKWNDYRKLTRGLATILFSPAELATCSVTGQRWSRAGNGERPVKPALDRAKVQAIISYVAARFPMVEISRIKQVLAYKCKENSTSLKMKAVRFYGHGEPHGN